MEKTRQGMGFLPRSSGPRLKGYPSYRWAGSRGQADSGRSRAVASPGGFRHHGRSGFSGLTARLPSSDRMPLPILELVWNFAEAEQTLERISQLVPYLDFMAVVKF